MLQTNDLGNVSSRTHTRKEWQLLKRLAATSSPIFLSLYVDVSVHGELSTGTSMPSEPEPEEPLWPFLIRVVLPTVFVVIMLTICVTSSCRCEGKCRDTPSHQPPAEALPTTHIYENDE